MTTERTRGPGEKRPWLGPVDRRWLLRVVGLGLGGFVLGYLLTALLFFPGDGGPPIVAVPDLREMDVAGAREVLEEVDLELAIGDSLPHPQVREGRVLSQSPLPGQEVAPGSEVRVILSTGREVRSVPVVRSLNREQAVRVLTASGFEVQVVESPDPAPAGRVLRVEPAAGSTVRLPAAVRLVVSAGPPLVAVPELLGLGEEEARRRLEAAGLRLGEVDYVFAGLEAREEILAQDPPPGDSIRQGQSVRVRMGTDRLPGTVVR